MEDFHWGSYDTDRPKKRISGEHIALGFHDKLDGESMDFASFFLSR